MRRNRYDFPMSGPANDDDDLDIDKRKRSIHSVPFIFANALFAALIGLFFVAHAIDSILPIPVSIADESLYPDSFVAERAQHDLKNLTDIGPRVVGSHENEILAVHLLQQEIVFIQQQANANQTIEVDLQVVSGSYFLNFKPYGAINAYGNIQNIVVRLASKNNSKYSLLVNSHFDSVPTSPGGSDDGINCVAMLEILRKLSRSPHPPEHNIIFLFNGAEESPLQAAHGFITKHRWAKEAKVVVNLDSAGHGGKIVLFQSGPKKPWLMKYYNMVPHPYAQASGEELFQSNVIPSDTDFRLFRDFGGLIGLDMAFVKSGYRYHTKYDTFDNIPLGSFQHVGDNALFLVKSLANAPELGTLEEQPYGKPTYFDVFGWFMVSYSDTLAIILNLLGITISFVAFAKCFKDFELGFSKGTFKYVMLGLLTIVLGWVAAILFIAIEAVIIDALGYSMSWYRNTWLIFGLYCAPIVMCTSVSILIFNRYCAQKKFCISVQTQIQIHLVRLIWTNLLIVAAFFGIRTSYVILVPVAFHAFILIVFHILQIHRSVRVWQISYVVLMLIPLVNFFYQANLLFAFVVPICGRIGNDINPELIIGVLAALCTILATSFYIPLVTLVYKPWYFICTLLAIFAVFFILVLTPTGFPYSGDQTSPTPQRFWIFHTSRVFHNESGDITKTDSGFLFTNLDRNSPQSVRKYIPDLARAKSVAQDCEVALFCGLPLVHTRAIGILKDSTWIPAGKPIIHEPVQLVVNSKEKVTPTSVRINLTITGPDHMMIYLSPKKPFKVVNISLLEKLPDSVPTWNDRPVYITVYTYGKEKTPLEFTCDIEVDAGYNGTTTEIGLVGRYVQKRIHKTPQYQQLLSQFPDWADVIPWLGTFESWII